MRKGQWGTSVEAPRNQGEEERDAEADFGLLSLTHWEDEVANDHMEMARSGLWGTREQITFNLDTSGTSGWI